MYLSYGCSRYGAKIRETELAQRYRTRLLKSKARYLKRVDCVTSLMIVAKMRIGIMFRTLDVMQQQRFMRVLRAISMRIGLHAMPSLRGLRLAPWQLKIILLLIRRKRDLVLFIVQDLKRNNEIAIARNNPGKTVAELGLMANMSGFIYRKRITDWRQKVREDMEDANSMWEGCWREKIRRQRFEIADARGISKNLWDDKS